MRMSVVLPAPSGPMSPNISPALDGEAHRRERDRVAVAFRDAFDPDGGVAHLRCTSAGIPILSTPGGFSIETLTA